MDELPEVLQAQADEIGARLADRELVQDVTEKLRDLIDRADSKLLITLTNGIKLRIVPTSQAAARRLVMQYPKPRPPLAKGRDDIMEENPLDPDYIEAQAVWSEKLINAIWQMMTILGTKCEVVPSGRYGPDDEGWMDELELAGLEVDRKLKGLPRYQEWLNLYALTSAMDQLNLGAALMARLGILESEVRDAVAAFRGGQVRGPDRDADAEAPDRPTDSVQPDLARAGV